MKSIPSIVCFVLFTYSFYLATITPDYQDKAELLMVMSFSAMLFILIILTEEKNTFFQWIEGFGVLLWAGIGTFFGLTHLQLL